MLTGKQLILATRPFAKEDRGKSWIYTITTLVLLIIFLLGTVFNFNIDLFDKILQAFNTFDQENFLNKELNLTNFRVVVSMGEELYELFQKKIKNKDFHLNQNILLFPSVPQVDVLKRASLFITHAGMNSASETIRYAVPVICIPQFSDQPLVAKRICDELNFGINLNSSSEEFDSNLVKNTVYQVLNEKSFESELHVWKELKNQNKTKK
jgi:UDP:flavonoid glycosyltransferase YjiC (YdhE family)